MRAKEYGFILRPNIRAKIDLSPFSLFRESRQIVSWGNRMGGDHLPGCKKATSEYFLMLERK